MYSKEYCEHVMNELATGLKGKRLESVSVRLVDMEEELTPSSLVLTVCRFMGKDGVDGYDLHIWEERWKSLAYHTAPINLGHTCDGVYLGGQPETVDAELYDRCLISFESHQDSPLVFATPVDGKIPILVIVSDTFDLGNTFEPKNISLLFGTAFTITLLWMLAIGLKFFEVFDIPAVTWNKLLAPIWMLPVGLMIYLFTTVFLTMAWPAKEEVKP